jgi:O-antigen/teichoic acid export membrane protein
VALPFLFWQDGGRYVAFARGRPSIAAFSDGLWLALQVAGFLVIFGLGRASTASLFATWAVAGALAGGVAGLRLGLTPRMSGALAWLRRHWPMCRRLLLENVITSGGVYAMFYGLVIVSDAGQLGHLKAAQTLLGPVSVLLLGGAALGVPESVRTRDDRPRMDRFARRLSIFLGGFTVACGTFVYLTISLFGPRLFPDAWRAAKPLIPLLVVFNAALGISTGATSAIRALGDIAWIVRARAASTLVVLGIGLPAAALAGANGALLGLAVAESLLAIAAWKHFSALRPPIAAVGEPAGPEPTPTSLGPTTAG